MAEFKYLTSDASRVTAVQAGEVDIATLFDPQNIAVLKATTTDYEISAIQSSRPIALTFSPNEPALQDVRVRRAIAHGIDVKAITESIFFGLTEPLAGQALTPPYPYHNDALKPFAYDPELSKKLLAEAGHTDGIDLSFEFRTDGAFLADRSVVQAIIEQLALIGVRVKPKPVTWAEYNRNVAEGKQGSFALTGGNPPSRYTPASYSRRSAMRLSRIHALKSFWKSWAVSPTRRKSRRRSMTPRRSSMTTPVSSTSTPSPPPSRGATASNTISEPRII